MGKMLFVGVTCADVVINVDRLPRTAQDVIVYGQKTMLGGCAFNAFSVAHALGEPALLFSPVGTGAFGDFVRKGLEAEGVPVLVENPHMENGCCYCFVEPGGERTFISYHGADYHYEPAWFDELDMDEVDAVYSCGLEIEDPTGPVVVDFLERACADKRLFFTPGPRPESLPMDLVERVYDLHPLLHMNADEACVAAAHLTGDADAFARGGAADGGVGCGSDAGASSEFGVDPAVVRAVGVLQERVGNIVFATMGPDGCYFDTGERRGVVPGVAATVVDTIGAGDSHIGALMSALHRGESIEGALARANRVASAVVGASGAHLPRERVAQAAGY